MRLHIDIETYSSVDIKLSGLYKYAESPDFEVLLFGYAIDDDPVQVIDLTKNQLPDQIVKLLKDPKVTKVAHNATFERVCLSKHIGSLIPVEQWECTMVKAAYCGLPLKLETVAEVLELPQEKDKEGKALIKFFAMPCKPTKANGLRERNLPEHAPEKWAAFIDYCRKDVIVERLIDETLARFEWPAEERLNYIVDARINDRGIAIDAKLAAMAAQLDEAYKDGIKDKMRTLTGLDNPNSITQLTNWIEETTGIKVDSLNKDVIPDLIKQTAGSPAEGVLRLRQQLAKSSTAKYTSMLNCECQDGRARGLFQFYGANRTGRFAGRLIQLQNLPQNHLEPLDFARQLVRAGDGAEADCFFGDLSSVLSQLVRTALVPSKGNVLAVADFSAIEARVLAWLAQEEWRLEIFATTGKIYEASAEMMFKLPKGSVDKHSPYRQRGKVAELALGYGGSVGAITTMDRDGAIPENEKQGIVNAWRAASPAIVAFWEDVSYCAMRAIGRGGVWKTENHGIAFKMEDGFLTIQLPSGRKLFYANAGFTTNRFGGKSIKYRQTEQTTGKWLWHETYAGKLVENITQAVARDILCVAMRRMDAAGLPIVLHVHDEVGADVPKESAQEALDTMLRIMAEPIDWADGLLLKGDGFITDYYKKD